MQIPLSDKMENYKLKLFVLWSLRNNFHLELKRKVKSQKMKEKQ